MNDKPPGLVREKYLRNYVEYERRYFRSACNFTDDELDVFNILSRGRSAVFAAIELGMSERTVYNLQKCIWKKIEKVIEAP